MANIFTYTVNEDGNTCTITGREDVEPEVIIPDVIDGYTVTAIDDFAFSENLEITKVVIPDTVSLIGWEAFNFCENLASLTIGKGVKVIKDNAFGYLAITELVLPDGLEMIGMSAFCNLKITELTIPDSVHTIGSGAFEENSELLSVVIGKGVESLGSGAFKDCTALKEATVNCSVNTIDREMFSGCTSLTTVVIGGGVERLSYDVFKGCSSLLSVTLPDSMWDIYPGAFSGCNMLRAARFGTDGWRYNNNVGSFGGTEIQMNNSSIAARSLSNFENAHFFREK